MVHSAFKDCDIVTVGRADRDDWQDSNIKSWVTGGRGKVSFQSKITDQTTHLVVGEKQWKTQPAVVQEALKRSEQGQGIHIVTFEWLGDSATAKAKRAESRYLWVKKARAAMQEKGQPRSTAGLVSQLFTEETDGLISEKTKKRNKELRRLELEEQKEREKRELDEFNAKRDSTNYLALKELISRSILKNRNELLTDKNHIYIDGMGFAWNVVLEPVEKTGGPNDPPAVSLQIFESKTEPPTYAFNAKAHQTPKLPQNNIIVCMGCNFLTAFRSFRNIFKEYTGVEWADRAKAGLKNGKKYKFVLPEADSTGERGEGVEQGREEDKSRTGSPGQSDASNGKQELKKDSQPTKTLERLEAKVAQRAFDKQSDETVDAGHSTLGKRKDAEDGSSEDEPPSKLRKSKGRASDGEE
ncbi:hypothetical protein PRZ48_000426 [Zasmidium cellare]|uniref:BRCT domain-containing protein n=1 Tax=Zasmidium cellare TaxID=395010 RepID=A0ABR0F0U0_ZASCE|nr:hypothetical protein PRZ48_000426 [Zasmidium cellare]